MALSLFRRCEISGNVRRRLIENGLVDVLIHLDPEDDPWLKTLSKRKWRIRVIEIEQIKLNPELMNYVDRKQGYVFQESLAQRQHELQEVIQSFGVVIWPLVIRGEGMQLVDGYCRYATLKAMGVSRVYVYVGVL